MQFPAVSAAEDSVELSVGRIAPSRGLASVRWRSWLLYLNVGLTAIVVYFALSSVIQDIWYDLFGVFAVSAIVSGVRRYRPVRSLPWYVTAAGLSMLVVGDLILNSYESVFHQPIPFPSLADAFFLCGNLTVVVALVLVTRTRVPGGDSGSLIDAAIIATGAGVLAWVFLMVPYAEDPSLTLLQQLVSIAYPMIDVLMLAVAARLIFAPGARTPSFRFVVLAIVATLVADVIYAELVLTGSYANGSFVDGIWLLWYVFWGTAALHPSMRVLTEPGPVQQTQLTRLRLVLLAAAALLIPAARVVQWIRVEPVDVPVTSIGSAVMFLLVLIRMSGLMQAMEVAWRNLERVVTREQTLRKAAAALVAAPSREGIYAATLDAAADLAGNPATEVRVAINAAGELAIVAALGADSTALEGTGFDLDALSPSAFTALLAQQAVPVSQQDLPELWQEFDLDPAAEAAVLTPLVVQQDLRGLLVVTGGRVVTDGVRAGLEALGSQVALALESAALAEDLHRRKNEERFHSLVRNASDIILITEADGTIRYVSPSVERVLGYRSDGLIGTSSFAWLHPDDLARVRGFHAEVVTATGTSRAVEYRVRHADGQWHHVEAIGNNLLDDPSVRGIVINTRDISERKQAEDKLAYQAFHDPLTNLPNRTLFMDRLEQALERSARRQEITAVLFLDLDRFKVVNDSLGHEAGDQLLVAAARRLVACLRPGDTAARLGGDEFTLLLEGVADELEAVRVAQQVAAEFEPAIDVGGRSVFVTTSIGIALSKPGHHRPADLLREADIAMYQAKAKGKASYALFDAEMGSSALRRLELETELRRAIEREQLYVEYQPVIELGSGKVTAMEALVRWQHPGRGFVPPVEFIALAEETGLILPLGRWVLEEACRQARAWQEHHAAEAPAVSVNLSVKQFQHPNIVDDIERTLQAVGLPASSLTLEITETVVMEDAESNSVTLQSLKALGVKLAIDDFGSGYSSLGYLKRFPVDILKIDRAFVGSLGRDPEDTAIVEAVINLAHTLAMHVTAEGVETAQQLAQLQALGCDLAQGYYFSPSRPAQAAEMLIEQQPWAAERGLALAATA